MQRITSDVTNVCDTCSAEAEGSLPSNWKTLSVKANSPFKLNRTFNVCNTCCASQDPNVLKKIRDLLL